MAETTQQGIAALKSGDRAAAKQLLGAAVKENPADILAWLWLSGAVDSDEERAACLRQVLRLDPNNAAASKGLAQLQERLVKRHMGGQQSGQQPAASPSPAASPAPAQPRQPEPANQQQAAPPPAPTRQPGMVENQSPWATASAAADSVASAVYGLRSELEAQPAEDTQRVEPAAPPADSVEEKRAEPAVSEDSLLARAFNTGAAMPSQADAAAANAPAAPAAPAPTPYTPSAAPRAAAYPMPYTPAEPAGRPVFRTRPSNAPVLIAFWVFFFGSFATANILGQANALAGIMFGLVLGILLELEIIYIAIRNFQIRYELTSQHLSLPYKGKQVNIPIRDIFDVEYRQSFAQRLLGLGNIYLDASVGGELAKLRMRDVPQSDARTQQIMYLVKDIK